MIIKESFFKKILQFIFFAALASPLIVDTRLFFPYVTASGLFFRITTAFLFFGWLIFVIKFPKNRPRLNLLLVAFGVYMLALLAAVLFSQSRFLSFWGDAERMMGYWGMLHLFILFLAGSTLFREEKEKRALLHFFLAVSSVVAIYGLFQKIGWAPLQEGFSRIQSTLGNSSYLGAYLIFGLFFSAYFFFKNYKNTASRLIFGGAFSIQALAIFFSGTRAVFLGCAFGAVFILAVLLVKSKNRHAKKTALAGLILFFIFYGFIYLNSEKSWMPAKAYVQRITQISLRDATFQQRLMAWNWGLKGFLERPVLGWGPENFAEPFNKHFEAKYYNFATEEYFKRAHNFVVEHLATAGVFGLAAYFFFLSSVFYFIVKKFKQNRDSVYLAFFGGLFVAYLGQSLFMFDMLPSLLGFLVFLLAIDLPKAPAENQRAISEISLAPLLVLALAVFGFYLNNFILQPYRAIKDVVTGQILLVQNNYRGMDYIKRATQYGTFVDLDIRSGAANNIYNFYLVGGQKEKRTEDIEFAVNLYKKNLQAAPNDTYYNYKIAEILNMRYAVNLDERFRDEAAMYIQKSINTSPSRARVYYIQVENLLFAGDFDQAVKVASYAVSLNERLGESWWELAKVYYLKQDFPSVKKYVLKAFETNYYLSEKTLKDLELVFEPYASKENQIEYFELFSKDYDLKNYIYDSSLANLYYEMGNKEEAVFHARRAAELNPAIKDQVEKFIQKVEAF
ncbi:MAG: O-antigen ligase family protein [Candidatus Portnoybacteria bacterium]|nr:O-antigen ligase family protein [Candidatus Portnoybacteria bacterium]